MTALPLEFAILRTLLYADVFEFPLTTQEIHQFLIGVTATTAEVETALASSPLLAEILIEQNGCWAPRQRAESLALRREREAISERLWGAALRYGRGLAALPFVRMVAITGALSMRNATAANDDLDYLIVTTPGRVWLTVLFAVILVRWARLWGIRLCPNYVLAETALSQARRDLYIAHEIAQMIPLSGMALYTAMRHSNAWTVDYLPNAEAPLYPLPDHTPQGVGRWLQWVGERIFGGAWGDRLERWEMRRKQRKFQDVLPAAPASAAQLDAEQVKGHFEDHGARILAAYEARLAAHMPTLDVTSG